jgi:hypothetical protein
MYDRLKMQSEAFVRGFREVLDPVFLQVSTYTRSLCSAPNCSPSAAGVRR